MTQTLIMIAQGLDGELFREAMRIALAKKLSDAAHGVERARNNLTTPGRTDLSHNIIRLAPIARERAQGLLSALDHLDVVIAECQAAWEAIDGSEPSQQKPKGEDDEEIF